jgi:hypothetical protein
MRAPLDVRLLATRYKLLDVLLTPVLFMFRRISDRQDNIQRTLFQRGWENEIVSPAWLKERGKKKKQNQSGKVVNE